jgi:uncharacterized protein YktA (UPF0223 family)
MATFDTTKQQSIYPGISATQGVVDKSGAIKPGIIGDIGAVTEMGLKGLANIDKLDALEDARLNAETIVDDYLAGSPTEQNYLVNKQLELTSNVSNSSGEEQSKFMQELNSVNERLVRAKAQGAMTPYEFSRRVAKVNTDLARANPAYTGEITSKMNEVFKTSGINDVISADVKYAEAQRKAQEAHQKLIYGTLEKYHIDPYVLDQTQLMEEFNKVRQIEVAKNEYELLLQTEDFADKYSGELVYNTIQSKGGLTRVRQAIYHGMDGEIQTILSDTQSDFKQKQRQVRSIIELAKQKYYTLVESLPQDKKAVSSFITQTDAMFTDIEKKFENDITLEDYKKFAQNRKSIVDSTLDADFMIENGASFQMIESLDKLASAYKTVQKVIGTGEASRKLKGLISTLGGRVVTDPNGVNPELADMVNDSKGRPYNNVVKQAYSTIIDDMENNGGQIPESTHKLATNELVFINNITNYAEKAERLDRTLRSQIGVPQQAFDQMYSRPEMKVQLNRSLAAYAGITTQNLRDLKTAYGPQWQIQFNPERGEVFSNTPEINNALNRVNAYIKIRAKIDNKNPKDIAEDIIGNNFPILIDKNTIPDIATEEDYNALPSGTEYKRPDGKIGVKK